MIDAYLDNAATTKPQYFGTDYFSKWHNSNAAYAFSEQNFLTNAREMIKRCLNVNGGYVLFTRCATESIAWLSNMIGGVACSEYEHDSVYGCRNLDIEIEAMYARQLVNQLNGHIFDIENVAKRARNAGYTFVGSDYTAAIGHVDLPKNADNYLDAIWWSGHKFYAEKGIGGIWISDRLFDFVGGDKSPHNQYGLIHGTVNAPAAMAMAEAMQYATHEISYQHYDYDILSNYLSEALSANEIEHEIIDKPNHCGAINLVYLPHINADALQMYLADKRIYVSIAASACADDANRYRVAKAFGLSEEMCEQSIRVSFGVDSDGDDINRLVDGIVDFKNKFCK